MPFFRDGVFHVYYLRDIGHHNHPIVGPLGGHEWAHCVSTDLEHFEELPLALPLDFEAGECSNCTGSVFAAKGRVYAFYALRSRHFKGEQFRVAVSVDGGKTFRKLSEPDLSAPPPGYTGNFRDPLAFEDENGLFHILITTSRQPQNPFDNVNTGELLHYTTEDFVRYRCEGTFLRTNGIPECSDLFFWKDRYYLFYSLNWKTHVLTADSPCGPWQVPAQDIPASHYCAVMKTAPWKDGRRIGVAWVPPKIGQQFEFGGKMIFREMIQNPDGSLGTAFLPEALKTLKNRTAPDEQVLADPSGLAQVFLGEMPKKFRLEGEIEFSAGIHSFGFQLSEDSPDGYRRLVEFLPAEGNVFMDRFVSASLWKPRNNRVFFRLERFDDILDLEFDGNRTLTLSGADLERSGLFFQSVAGTASLKQPVLYT